MGHGITHIESSCEIGGVRYAFTARPLLSLSEEEIERVKMDLLDKLAACAVHKGGKVTAPELTIRIEHQIYGVGRTSQDVAKQLRERINSILTSNGFIAGQVESLVNSVNLPSKDVEIAF